MLIFNYHPYIILIISPKYLTLYLLAILIVVRICTTIRIVSKYRVRYFGLIDNVIFLIDYCYTFDIHDLHNIETTHLWIILLYCKIQQLNQNIISTNTWTHSTSFWVHRLKDFKRTKPKYKESKKNHTLQKIIFI